MQTTVSRLIALLAVLVSTTAFAQPTTRQWTVDDTTRDAIVAAPASAKTDASPLIFAFHGHGGRMRGLQRSLPFEKAWPEAIVVYPQGLPTPGRLTDLEGKLPGWQSAPGEQRDRDLKFFDAMLETIEKEYKVDPDRIYATGHSNGGTFSYVLWQARGEKFAAFAPVASALRLVILNADAPDAKYPDVALRPILHIAGQNDNLVKFEWQQNTITALRKINHCTDGKPWGDNKNCTIYPSPDGAPVVAYIHAGGHEMPKDASESIVKFFKENARQQAKTK